MKTLPKILTIIFLVIFILQIFSLFVIFLSPQISLAADVKFTPQIGINKDFVANKATDVSPTSIGLYIMAIYKYAIGIVGILATVILMFGGLKWITSGGNQEKISDARAWIAAAITGVVLMMASYLILYTVNPELVKIQSIEPKDINTRNISREGAGCCEWSDKAADGYTKEECESGDYGGVGIFKGKEYIASKTKCIEKPKEGCVWVIATSCSAPLGQEKAKNDTDCGTKTNKKLKTCCCKK